MRSARAFAIVVGLAGIVGCTDPGAGALCKAIVARDVAGAEAVLRAGPVDWLRQQWTCQPAKDAIDLAGEGATEGVQILRAMLRAGLDPNATFSVIGSSSGSTSSSRTSLTTGSTNTTTHSLAEWAANAGVVDVITALREAGLNMTSDRTAQAVVIAARNGNMAIVQQLVEAGAPVNTSTGPTALGSAVAERHHPVIAYLETKGARESAGPHLSLFQAARKGDVAAVKAALAGGADANVEDAHKTSLLLRASAFGQVEVVEMLLAAKANPSQWSWGESALQAAAKEGHANVVRALLKGRADVNARVDASSNTALVVAVQAGRTDAVLELLAGGADHAIPGIGGTPLMFAVQQKRLPIVQALLNARANPNQTRWRTSRPLCTRPSSAAKTRTSTCRWFARWSPLAPTCWRRTPKAKRPGSRPKHGSKARLARSTKSVTRRVSQRSKPSADNASLRHRSFRAADSWFISLESHQSLTVW